MIGNDWDNILESFFESSFYKQLITNVYKEYDKKIIYPSKDHIFNALKLTSFRDTVVVIVGQDPYHGENEANGLSFSVQKGVKIPPSLQNIYKELYNDLKIKPKEHGDLTNWAKEGVLLLNSILTVEKDNAGSHKNIGWQLLTNHIISLLNEKNTPVVFILWGNYAREKSKLITKPIHLILTSPHPSPFSCYNGFYGSKPFSKTNEFLKKNKMTTIDWSL